MTLRRPAFGLSPKLLLLTEATLLVAILAILVPVRQQMRKQVVDDMQRELTGIAATAALSIDGDAVARVRVAEDAGTPEFERLRDHLARVRDANRLTAEHIYTFYRDGPVVRFGVMTHAKPFVGDPWPLRPEMLDVFDRGRAVATELYADDMGSWISAYAPIRDARGAVVALLEVDRPAEEYFRRYRLVSAVTVALGLAVLGVTSIAGWFVLRRVVLEPMRLVRDGVSALARQDFAHRVRIKTRDEFELLADAMNNLFGQLDTARMIQSSFIPKALPATSGYRFAALSEPCDTTAGDYLDAFPLPGGRVAVLVADVTGHGLGPALLMSACRSAVRALAGTGDVGPAELVARVEAVLTDDLENGRFVTMVYGVLEPDGAFTYANAGHAPAIVVSGGVARQLPSHRTPIGIPFGFDDFGDAAREPAETTIRLDPGDRLLLATDGLVECTNPAGEMFGDARMTDVLTTPGLTCDDVVARLKSAVLEHARGRARADDLTLLCVDRVTVYLPAVTDR